MGALTRESDNQFRVRLADLTGGLLGKLFGGERHEIDPYVIARAVREVMRRSSARSPSGRRLLWNEYRLILAPPDFEHLRSLQSYLHRELKGVLEREAQRLRAELVGDLCVHLVVDEARELEAGEAVVRVAFSANDRIAAPVAGEMTVRLGAGSATGELVAPAAPPQGGATVPVEEEPLGNALVASYRLAWPGGEAELYMGVRTFVGRPHPGHPPQFVPLTGAGPRVSKQHIWIVPMASRAVVGRPSGANPVSLAGRSLPAGEELELSASPVELSLSHGELVLTLTRLGPGG